MGEYIKKEDVLRTIAWLLSDSTYSDLCLETSRSNEAETIVHCKDCKYSIEVKASDHIICKHPSQHSTYDRTGDDYCSFGKRREKENER